MAKEVKQEQGAGMVLVILVAVLGFILWQSRKKEKEEPALPYEPAYEPPEVTPPEVPEEPAAVSLLSLSWM